MTWNDHTHSEYAGGRHDHDGDYAPLHHRHYDLENDGKASRRITGLQDDVDGLRGRLGDALGRIAALEKQTPQARQLQYEAGLAAADLAESGYDRHGRGCQCPYCLDEAEEEPAVVGYDPGPEADGEGGMSEYRYPWPEDYGRGM